MKVRRVVTGQDAAGKSVFVSDTEVEPIELAIMPGTAFHRLWGSDDPPTLPTDGDAAVDAALLPSSQWLPLRLLHARAGFGDHASRPRHRRRARGARNEAARSG